ncbi:hypothetical protein ACFQX6_66335 [Streptosporangium lutulentum]
MTTAPATLDAPTAAATSAAPTIRQQIRAYLNVVLAADTTQSAAALLQVDRARMLKAVHGADLVAGVYAEWLREHQDAALKDTAPLTSFDELSMACAPIPRWTRDMHGFLCVCCAENQAQVRTTDDDADLCRICARRELALQPGEVRLLSHPAAHGHLMGPGLYTDGRARHQVPQIEVPLTDGSTARYTAGDIIAFASTYKGLTVDTDALSGDIARPQLQLTAHTTAEGHTFALTVVFDYDPTPQHGDGGGAAAYGFRLTTATLTDSRGRISAAGDLHELLDAITRGEPADTSTTTDKEIFMPVRETPTLTTVAPPAGRRSPSCRTRRSWTSRWWCGPTVSRSTPAS